MVKVRNPRTGRMITVGGQVWKKLQKTKNSRKTKKRPGKKSSRSSADKNFIRQITKRAKTGNGIIVRSYYMASDGQNDAQSAPRSRGDVAYWFWDMRSYYPKKPIRFFKKFVFVKTHGGKRGYYLAPGMDRLHKREEKQRIPAVTDHFKPPSATASYTRDEERFIRKTAEKIKHGKGILLGTWAEGDGDDVYHVVPKSLQEVANWFGDMRLDHPRQPLSFFEKYVYELDDPEPPVWYSHEQKMERLLEEFLQSGKSLPGYNKRTESDQAVRVVDDLRNQPAERQYSEFKRWAEKRLRFLAR